MTIPPLNQIWAFCKCSDSRFLQLPLAMQYVFQVAHTCYTDHNMFCSWHGTTVSKKRLQWDSIRMFSKNTVIYQSPTKLGFRWNRYACSINEALIRDTATQMKSLGFLVAGYNYINIDDCWNTKSRSATGELVVDATKFPSLYPTIDIRPSWILTYLQVA